MTKAEIRGAPVPEEQLQEVPNSPLHRWCDPVQDLHQIAERVGPEQVVQLPVVTVAQVPGVQRGAPGRHFQVVLP